MATTPTPFAAPPSPERRAAAERIMALYEGAAFVMRRLGLRHLHVLSDQGEPKITFDVRGDLVRFELPRHRPAEPTVNASFLLAVAARLLRGAR